MNPDECDRLIWRYLDGRSSETEEKELKRLLDTNDTVCRRFAELSMVNTALNDSLAAEEAPAAAKPTARKPAAARPGARSADRIRRTRRRSWVRIGIAAACLAVIAGALVYNDYQHRQTGVRFIAHVQSKTGNVVVLRSGNQLTAVVGLGIAVGDILTTGDGESAALTYDGENTRIDVGPATRLGIGSVIGGKKLELTEGTIDASVAPQPENAPMTVTTLHARAQVEGTVFNLTTDARSTRLTVTEGMVRLTCLADGQSTDVAAGQSASVTKGTGLAPAAAPAPRPFVVTKTIPLPEDAGKPKGLAFDGEFLWLTNRGPDILYRIDPDSGEVTLRHALEKKTTGLGDLAWDGEHLWICHGSIEVRGNVFSVVDRSTGNLRPHVPMPEQSGFTSLAVGDGLLWAGYRDGRMFGLGPADGAQERSFTYDEALAGRTTFADGALWIHGRDRISRMDPASGAILSTHAAPVMDVQDMATEGSGVLWALDSRSKSIARLEFPKE